ncbi:MAG TPA: hypothetical protein VNT42_00900 [Sphingomonas sp.]|nr:hypothetical protein [Sphingomonas sp.]
MADEEEKGACAMTPAQEIAARAIDPCATSSQIVAAFREEGDAAIDPDHGQAAMRQRVEAVRNGKFDSAEATLVGQAAALNAIFAHMARRGQAHLDQPGKRAERYLRLALRAQTQCRATLNVLAHVSGQRPEEPEPPRQITQIERRIVYPPREPGGQEIVRSY